jgi:hypothetical protein
VISTLLQPFFGGRRVKENMEVNIFLVPFNVQFPCSKAARIMAKNYL